LYRDKTSIKTVIGDRLVVASHQLLRCGHSGVHAETRARNVGVGGRYILYTTEVLVAGCWRLFLKVEFIFALEFFFVEILNRLAVRARLMCATMLGKVVRARESLVTQRADVWSFLCVGAHVPLEVL
jgi:hypothetical protein